MQKYILYNFMYLSFLSVLIILLLYFQPTEGSLLFYFFLISVSMFGLWLNLFLGKIGSIDIPYLNFLHKSRPYRKLTSEEIKELLNYYQTHNNVSKLFFIPFWLIAVDFIFLFPLFSLTFLYISTHQLWALILQTMCLMLSWVYVILRYYYSSNLWSEYKQFDLHSPVYQIYGKVTMNTERPERDQNYDFRIGNRVFYIDAVSDSAVNSITNLQDDEKIFLEYSPASRFIWHVERKEKDSSR